MVPGHHGVSKRRFGMGLAIGAAALIHAGCAPTAKLRIVQQGLPPPQDVVRLTSHWAYAATGPGALERVILMFPLPGAEAGDKQFYLYLRLPGKRSKPIAVGEPLADGSRAGGFLIQAKGQFAGKALFTSGEIAFQGSPFDGGKLRRGQFTFYCADGSVVDGTFTATVAPLEVRDFEDLKAGDVQAYIRGRKQTTDPARPNAAPQDRQGNP